MTGDAHRTDDHSARSEGEQYLLQLPRFAGKKGSGFKPGLRRIRTLLAEMGDPHEKFASVHIAGTNGKGSTAAMTASIATAGGWRCGLHTSPHLFSLTERMRVDGNPASPSWLDQEVSNYESLFEEVQPSFFEATVALSFLYFARQQVDFAVIETGLGGRLDATNVITPEVSIITHIGMDHQHLLGDSIEEIAREKGGIIKEGVPIISGVCHPDACRELEAIASEKSAPYSHAPSMAAIHIHEITAGYTVCDIHLQDSVLGQITVGMGGEHQLKNALLAILAAQKLGMDPLPVAEGLRRVRELSGMRGRLEVLLDRPLTIADVGHNADAWELTFDHLQRVTSGRLHVAFGVMADKDIARFIELCQSTDACVYPLELSSERALPVERLTERLKDSGVDVESVDSLEAARMHFADSARADDALLITGSHHVVAMLQQTP